MVDTGDEGRMLAASTEPRSVLPYSPPSATLTAYGRRATPSAHEQERRKAWGREWGAVGAEYKRRRLQGEQR